MKAEILAGPERRRRWSAEEKARIVSETMAAGAQISDK
jgi:transposase-like protein